jgi:hypothetical protein
MYFQNTSLSQIWIENYATGTNFIHFVAYPFVKFGFNYEMMMVLFAWFGYWGFVCFYLFFLENISSHIYWKGYDFVTILLFLPNMHFWTSSFGKGSLIFMGIGLFTYAMMSPQKRLIALILGLAIVYHIRPHIFLFISVGAIVGYITGKEEVSFFQKFVIVSGFVLVSALLYDKIVAFAGLDESTFQEFSDKRSAGLSHAGSGINLSSYPLPLKIFTFWVRPLFVDASGILGLFVSVENLFYVILFVKLLNRDFISFLKQSTSVIKMSIVIFLITSYAFSSVMSNLGITIRQKSAVMYFFLFVVLSFMDYQKKLKNEL